MVAAVASYLDARAHGGVWLVRIEDIDPPREQPGASTLILHTMERAGLWWDGDVSYQSRHRQRHLATIDELLASGHAYVCRCSRKDARSAAAASGLERTVYPGTCRAVRWSKPGAVRILTDDQPVIVRDRLQPVLSQRISADVGDFVIQRRDGLIAYQMAVVLDDAAAGISDIVRGVDLWANTPRQVWLQRALALKTPRYLHFPVVVDAGGVKLSKQTGAAPIHRVRPSRLLVDCLHLLRQDPPSDLADNEPRDVLSWAVRQWRPGRLQNQLSVDAGTIAVQQNPVR